MNMHVCFKGFSTKKLYIPSSQQEKKKPQKISCNSQNKNKTNHIIYYTQNIPKQKTKLASYFNCFQFCFNFAQTLYLSLSFFHLDFNLNKHMVYSG